MLQSNWKCTTRLSYSNERNNARRRTAHIGDHFSHSLTHSLTHSLALSRSLSHSLALARTPRNRCFAHACLLGCRVSYSAQACTPTIHSFIHSFKSQGRFWCFAAHRNFRLRVPAGRYTPSLFHGILTSPILALFLSFHFLFFPQASFLIHSFTHSRTREVTPLLTPLATRKLLSAAVKSFPGVSLFTIHSRKVGASSRRANWFPGFSDLTSD
jgi:hypothetical protein